ncbi:MAG: right-handed parallel beta-helix repeat-containing protein, partial [Bacteroidales bacterium]|nr:right-handed parallel beta-helix repeat-containing protein [Bacteroidales bacterium]
MKSLFIPICSISMPCAISPLLKMIFIFTGLLLTMRSVATIIIVDPGGGGTCTAIQEGIGLASNGDTVLVMPGNYIEIVDFSGKDIVLCSQYLVTGDTSYISQTIIDGNLENYRLVRFTNGETYAAKLTGFTITNAYLGQESNEGWEPAGLAIYINESSPVIERNRIIDNNYGDTYYHGGAIVIVGGSPHILENYIYDNDGAYEGGGIYIEEGNDIVISGNTIANHRLWSGYGTAFGAGIFIKNSIGICISRNRISDNYNDFGYGGGAYLTGCSDITFTGNIFDSNRCRGLGGSGVYAGSSQDVRLINNLIVNNYSAFQGGGILMEGSRFLLANNTICFNKADTLYTYGEGGGMCIYNSSGNVFNTILFGNQASSSGNQVFLASENADPGFYYCDIEGGLNAFGMEPGVNYTGQYVQKIDQYPDFVLSGE